MYFLVKDDIAVSETPKKNKKKSLEATHLEVTMFNVGGGEAILLVFPGKRAWIIDAGCHSNAKLAKSLLKQLEDRSLMLEVIVASHPHFDHADACTRILNSKSARISDSLILYRSDDPWWTDQVKNGDKKWIPKFHAAVKKRKVKVIKLKNKKKIDRISKGVTAHIFAGSGDDDYTSAFVQLRYHKARLFFSGDAHCKYEKGLIKKFGKRFFDSDVLKITHHGSSSGTATAFVDAVKPGIAIASTGHDGGHRLEADTLERVTSRGSVEVFETIVEGDITLKTDGKETAKGVLYKVELWADAGLFRKELKLKRRSLARVNKTRTRSRDRGCV